MTVALALPYLLKSLEQIFETQPDTRCGPNTQYALADAGVGAFAVFFTQSPSFLAHQRAMAKTQRLSNAERLFGVHALPTDPQIRNLLDPIAPAALGPLYRHVFRALDETGVLKTRFRSFGHHLVLALDGTQYFSSQAIHCPSCSQRKLNNGETQYFHSVLTPVLVHPSHSWVLALEPEFIVPQDGHEKQDCEIQAAQRWLQRYGAFYAAQGTTILGDDLYCHPPFCEALQKAHLHFILICKPDSHVQLYTTVTFLETKGLLGVKTVRRWNGRFGEIHRFRYAEDLPLTGERDTLLVHWCEWTITREGTDEILYHNAWATDFRPSDTTVEALAREGRARWRIENENNNVLKTKGYHLEHNYGHGLQHLSALLLSLNLLAFLFHTVLDLVDERYQAIRQALGTRRTFFQDLETLLRYIPFPDWDALWTFMYNGLELNSS